MSIIKGFNLHSHELSQGKQKPIKGRHTNTASLTVKRFSSLPIYFPGKIKSLQTTTKTLKKNKGKLEILTKFYANITTGGFRKQKQKEYGIVWNLN